MMIPATIPGLREAWSVEKEPVPALMDLLSVLEDWKVFQLVVGPRVVELLVYEVVQLLVWGRNGGKLVALEVVGSVYVCGNGSGRSLVIGVNGVWKSFVIPDGSRVPGSEVIQCGKDVGVIRELAALAGSNGVTIGTDIMDDGCYVGISFLWFFWERWALEDQSIFVAYQDLGILFLRGIRVQIMLTSAGS